MGVLKKVNGTIHHQSITLSQLNVRDISMSSHEAEVIILLRLYRHSNHFTCERGSPEPPPVIVNLFLLLWCKWKWHQVLWRGMDHRWPLSLYSSWLVLGSLSLLVTWIRTWSPFRLHRKSSSSRVLCLKSMRRCQETRAGLSCRRTHQQHQYLLLWAIRNRRSTDRTYEMSSRRWLVCMFLT